MGFMDTLGGMAGKFMAASEEITAYKKEYKSLNDDKLFDVLSKYSSKKGRFNCEEGQRHGAAYQLLKDRGYDQSFLNSY